MDISPLEPVIDIGQPPPPPREPFWGYTDLMLVMGLVAVSIALIVLVTAFLVAFNPGLRDESGTVTVAGSDCVLRIHLPGLALHDQDALRQTRIPLARMAAHSIQSRNCGAWRSRARVRDLGPGFLITYSGGSVASG